MPDVEVTGRRVGRAVTVRWAVASRPPSACGHVEVSVTARSLTDAMPALGTYDSKTGSSFPLHDLSGETRVRDIIGPISPPYRATVTLQGEGGASVEAHGPVTATDDPSPEQVRAQLKQRETCRGDAGNPGDCHFPAPDNGVDAPLTGVTAASLAPAVTKALTTYGGSDLAVDSVTCKPAWSCTARFTLGYGRHKMRVTYRLRSGRSPKCWRLSGWHFTTVGPAGEALPTPHLGCIRGS